MLTTEIIPGLFMSGESLFPIPPTGFDAVISLREVQDIHFPAPEDLAQLGPFFIWCPLIDGPILPPFWKIDAICAALEKLHMSGQKILVHCSKGYNRSGLIVASYLVFGKFCSPQEAIETIRFKRPGSLTNQTFVDFILTMK